MQFASTRTKAALDAQCLANTYYIDILDHTPYGLQYIDILDLGTAHDVTSSQSSNGRPPHPVLLCEGMIPTRAQSIFTDTGQHDVTCKAASNVPSTPNRRGRPPKTCPGTCKGQEGHRYILVACDVASNYVTATSMRSKSEQDIYTALQSGIFSPFHIPHLLVSDGESALTGDFIQSRLREYGINHRTIAKGASWANKAELTIKHLKAKLRPAFTTKTVPLDLLTIILNTQNSTPNRNGLSPEHLMFSSTIGLPISLLNIIESAPTTAEDKAAADIIVNAVHKNRMERTKQLRDQANKHHKPKSFEIDQLVTSRDDTFSGGSKSLKIINKGPYVIKSISSPVSYVLQHVATGQVIKRHANSISPLHPRYTSTFLTPGWDDTIKEIQQRVTVNQRHTLPSQD